MVDLNIPPKAERDLSIVQYQPWCLNGISQSPLLVLTTLNIETHFKTPSTTSPVRRSPATQMGHAQLWQRGWLNHHHWQQKHYPKGKIIQASWLLHCLSNRTHRHHSSLQISLNLYQNTHHHMVWQSLLYSSHIMAHNWGWCPEIKT